MNPNKDGFYEVSLFGGGQFDPLPPFPRSYLRKNLSNVNIEIMVKVKKNTNIICYKLMSLVPLYKEMSKIQKIDENQ